MKISIITVVYNGARFLEGTIESVRKQTSNTFEYIIIDGGSTDGTLDIIDKYKNDIDLCISEPDTGLYDAMNKGLQNAKGDFVWFINAGDKIYNTSILEKLAKIADHTTADILYGDTLVIDENDKPIGMRRKEVPEKLSWKSLKGGMLVCHQSFIPKRELAPLYNLKYKYSSDIDWEIECLKNATRIENTKLVLSKFMDGGRSKKTIIPSLRERFGILVKNYGLLQTIFFHLVIGLRFFKFYFRHGRF